MGIVMIVCPKMGKAISTGMHIDRAAFRSMPVFFGSSTFQVDWNKSPRGAAIM
jgi:hypothetical protein